MNFVEHEKRRILKYFVEFLSNPEAKDRNFEAIDGTDMFGRNPLHYAAMYGETDNIRILIGARVNINVVDLIGDTPLFIAIRRQDHEMVTVLLLYGADPNLCKAGSLTPLMEATLLQNEYIVSILLAFGADPNIRYTCQEMLLVPNKSSALSIAAVSYNKKIIRIMQTVYCSANTVFHALQQAKSAEIKEMFLS